MAGKCSLERGGAAYHLHYQMIVRIQAVSFVAVSRLLKSYLGWDKKKPDGGIVICKKLTSKGLHTFHGMVGYCMKDATKDHFQTIDHNISAEGLAIGLEQLALHGQEECKERILLTQCNFAKKCLQWRRWNYKHPAVVDWEKEFFLMLKTGKYYPCTSWVVGTYGRGYEPHRMQSYWRLMVSPSTITREDVNAVFCQPEQISFPSVSRKQWFEHRWEDDAPVEETRKSGGNADDSIAEILLGMKEANELEKKAKDCQAVDEILVHTPAKCKSAPAKKKIIQAKRKRKGSPHAAIWSEAWPELFGGSNSSEGGRSSGSLQSSDPESLAGCQSALPFACAPFMAAIACMQATCFFY